MKFTWIMMIGIGVSAALPLCLRGAEESPPATNQPPRVVLYDPFSYRAPDSDGAEFVTDPDARIPPGIEVLAILHVTDKPPYAVLRIPGLRQPAFVSESDLIRVEQRGVAGQSAEPLYLLVRAISRHAVEISPQKRPSEIHVFH